MPLKPCYQAVALTAELALVEPYARHWRRVTLQRRRSRLETASHQPLLLHQPAPLPGGRPQTLAAPALPPWVSPKGAVTRDTAPLPKSPYSPFTPSHLTDREPLPGPRSSPLVGRPHHSEPSMVGASSSSLSSASSASGRRVSASLRMFPPVSSQPVTISSRTQPAPEPRLPATIGPVSMQLWGGSGPAESSAEGAQQQCDQPPPPCVKWGEERWYEKWCSRGAGWGA